MQFSIQEELIAVSESPIIVVYIKHLIYILRMKSLFAVMQKTNMTFTNLLSSCSLIKKTKKTRDYEIYA